MKRQPDRQTGGRIDTRDSLKGEKVGRGEGLGRKEAERRKRRKKKD